MTIASHTRLAAAALIAGMAAGCASESAELFPKMGDFSKITQKVLSPQEQEKTIQTMSAEQKAEQANAVKTIEHKYRQ